jgi:hypothetical protein
VATLPSACAGDVIGDSGVNDEVTKRHVNGATHLISMICRSIYGILKTEPAGRLYCRCRVIKSGRSVIGPDYHKMGYHLFSHNAP